MSCRKVSTPRDPYGEGFQICRFKEIEFHDGLTVLVGCNGAGKSTLLRHLADYFCKNQIPCFRIAVDKEIKHSLEDAVHCGDLRFACTSIQASEGENLGMTIGQSFQWIKSFLSSGIDKNSAENAKWCSMFDVKEKDLEKLKCKNHPERWILLDASDSGYSIDNIIELKHVFDLIKKDASSLHKDVYIIVSANSYELANGEDCMDIYTGKYIKFKDYEDYKKFILKTRDRKEKRYKEN